MSPRSTSRKPLLYRELTPAEKQSYWYVDVPDDRPTSGKRVSAQEWIRPSGP